MISGLFNALVHQPLYNGLIFLTDIIPGGSVGFAVIILTLVVKSLLFPLSRKAVLTQQKIKQIEPDLNAIKEKYKNDKQEQAKKILNFYKEKGVNPFASLFLMLVQLPIIITLYRIFWTSGLPQIQEEALYSFVSSPETVNMVFLGLVDISAKSWVLAILVGVATFIQMRLSMPAVDIKKGAKTFKEDLARSMNIQMKYVFPFLSIFISYSLSGAVALYWLTSNLFTITQEIFVKRNRQQKQPTSLVSAGRTDKVQ